MSHDNKINLKNAAGANTSEFHKTTNLTGLKPKADKSDKLDIDTLETVAVDLRKVNDLAINKVVKNTI